MSLDTTMLFAHVLIAMVLFGAATVSHLGQFQMRGATDVRQVRVWGRILHRVEPLMGPGTALLFLTGAYLVGQGFRWGDGWVVAATAAVVAMEILGGTVQRASGKRLGMLVAQAPDGPVPEDLRAAITAPASWVTGHAIDGMVVGVLYLMAAKPSMVTSFVVVGATAVLGGLTALPFVGRRAERRPAPAGVGA